MLRMRLKGLVAGAGRDICQRGVKFLDLTKPIIANSYLVSRPAPLKYWRYLHCSPWRRWCPRNCLCINSKHQHLLSNFSDWKRRIYRNSFIILSWKQAWPSLRHDWESRQWTVFRSDFQIFVRVYRFKNELRHLSLNRRRVRNSGDHENRFHLLRNLGHLLLRRSKRGVKDRRSQRPSDPDSVRRVLKQSPRLWPFQDRRWLDFSIPRYSD